MLNIMLADDHEMVRKGIRSLIESEPDFRVVAEAANGIETLRLAEEIRPDTLVLDLNIPEIGGLDLIQQLKSKLPSIRIVILSMYSNEVYVTEALRLGAEAYVLKEAAPAELVAAIREVSAGRYFLCNALAQSAFKVYSSKPQTEEKTEDPFKRLTARELQILQLIIEKGLTNAQIAEQLFISRRTVEIHRANIMKKLAFKSYSDLVRLAVLRGLLPSEKSAKLIKQ
ncbi:MAG: response regulator transcription factor [Dehalococcoidales bacterium]|nr:response regulator transcription factor [Dehalococcoidales bacterium]